MSCELRVSHANWRGTVYNFIKNCCHHYQTIYSRRGELENNLQNNYVYLGPNHLLLTNNNTYKLIIAINIRQLVPFLYQEGEIAQIEHCAGRGKLTRLCTSC